MTIDEGRVDIELGKAVAELKHQVSEVPIPCPDRSPRPLARRVVASAAVLLIGFVALLQLSGEVGFLVTNPPSDDIGPEQTTTTTAPTDDDIDGNSLIAEGDGTEILIPDLAGLDQSTARSTLISVGFSADALLFTTERSAVEAGRVIATRPRAGTRVEIGDPVLVVVSTGLDEQPFPNSPSTNNTTAGIPSTAQTTEPTTTTASAPTTSTTTSATTSATTTTSSRRPTTQAPLPSLSVSDEVVVEGDVNQTVLVRVALSTPSSSAVTVRYQTSNGNALANVDYLPSRGTLTIPAGQTSATVPIVVIGENVDEDEERFALWLDTPKGADIEDASGRITIVDDDEGESEVQGPTIALGDVSVVEGANNQQVSVTIAITGSPSSPITVSYSTISGTAVAGQDFVPAGQTVTIPTEFTGYVLSFAIIDDDVAESPEQFLVRLSDVVGAEITNDTAIVTIEDND